MFSKIYTITNKAFKIILSSVLMASVALGGLSLITANAGPSTTTPDVIISKLFDGTAPFETVAGSGNDTTSSNNLVRNGDITAYQFDFNLNDTSGGSASTYNNYTLTTQGLPIGLRWQALPAGCTGAGSALSGNGVTTPSVMTCNIGAFTTGNAAQINASVITLPIAPIGTQFSVTATVAVDGVTNTGGDTTSIINPLVTTTSSLKVDLIKTKSTSYNGAEFINGELGFRFAHGLGIRLKKGSEAPAMPLTLIDDTSSISPNAKVIGCGINGNSPIGRLVFSLPWGKLSNNDYLSTKLNAVTDSGSISCIPQAGNTQLTDISITGTDFNSSDFPTNSNPYDGQSLNPEYNYVAAFYVMVWIPASDFLQSNNYQINATNKFNDFAPVGAISGAANFGNPLLEPGRNMDNNATAANSELTGSENWYTQVYDKPPLGGNYSKWDEKYRENNFANTVFYGDNTYTSITIGGLENNRGDGTGILAAGSDYVGNVTFDFFASGDLPAGFISCQTIDNRYANVAALPSNPDKAAFVWNSYPQDFDNYFAPIIEYGVGGIGGVGTFWNEPTEMQTATCTDSESSGGWYSDLTTVPGGPSAVTKVRMRTTRTATAAEQQLIIDKGLYNNSITFQTHLKVLPTAPLGQIVPNYANFFDPSRTVIVNATGQSNGNYNYLNSTGNLGARVTIVGTRVRISKTVGSTTAESETKVAGSDNTWYLDSTSDALGVTPAGTALGVQIVDTIPSGLNYTMGSTVCSDPLPAIQPVSCQPSVVINSNGTSTLTWDFGDFTAGSAITKINYKTISDATALNNTSFVNSAEIKATNDNSQVQTRTNTATAVVVNTAAFAVQKKVLTPFVSVGEPVVFKLIEKNTGVNPVTSSDFIDWLPWNGDTRSPASSYTGKLDFTSLTNTAGVPATAIEFTKTPSSSVVIPADLDPNTVNPAFVWCTALSGGTCPANNSEITGFRIKTAGMTAGQGTEWDLTLTPDAANLDASGDIITNRFKGRVGGIAVPVESSNVFATVVSGTIGDTIYRDNNQNGIQDGTEPGLARALVELLDSVTNLPANCSINASTTIGVCSFTTDATGKYLFNNLAFGSYKVKITPPAGFTQTGDPDTTIDNESILTINNNSAATRTDLTGDFGYYQKVSIAGFVYVDTNNDGIKAPAEAAIGGVTMTLSGTDVNGVITPIVVQSDPTTGKYEFLNLEPGTYTVTETQPTAPPLYFDGKETTGTGATTAGATAQDDKITAIVLNAGDNSINNNFGELLPSIISGYIYEDKNNNGIKDAGEPGIIGQTVTLTGTDANGAITPIIATTDLNGLYVFSDLNVGTYIINEAQPAGYYDGKDALGTGATTIGTLANDSQTAIAIGIDQMYINNNFGEIKYTTISGFVYVDTDNDGVKDTGETTITGTIATLTGTDFEGTIIAPIDLNTDTNGNYVFVNLLPGTYTVTETQPSTPIAYLDGKDTAGTGSTTAGTTVQDDKITSIITTSGENSIDNNFGELLPPAIITGSVYLNPDNNGTQDGGEPSGSIPAGTTVVITSTTDPLVTFTATVNPDGTYFQVVPAGSYTVTVTPPAGYTVSTSTELGDGIGANPTTVTVAAGETKSQGKDGLYLTPVVVSSSSVASSSAVQSSSLTVASSSSVVSSSSASSSSSQTVSSSSVVASSSSVVASSSSVIVNTANTGGGVITINTTPTPIVDVKTNSSSSSNQSSTIPYQIGVKKITTGLIKNSDGTYSAGYEVTVSNLGQKDLENIYAYDYTSESFYDTNYTIEELTSDKFQLSNTFNGRSDLYLTTTPSTLLDESKLPDANQSDANAAVKTTNKLAIGEKAIITFKIKFNPKGKTGPFINSAGAVGYTREGERTEDDPPVDINIPQDGDVGGPDTANFNIPLETKQESSAINTVRTGGNSSDILGIILIMFGLALVSASLGKNKSQE